MRVCTLFTLVYWLISHSEVSVRDDVSCECSDGVSCVCVCDSEVSVSDDVSCEFCDGVSCVCDSMLRASVLC